MDEVLSSFSERSFRGEAALVIGARTGIGREVAQIFAHKTGFRVYGTSSSEGDPALQRLRYDSDFIDDDLLDLGLFIREQGQLLSRVFLCAAAIPVGTASREVLSYEWITQNSQLMGTYMTINALGPLKVILYLLENGLLTPNARVAILSSLAGSSYLRGKLEHMLPGGPIFYRASKACLNNFFVHLAFDLAETPMIVTLVHPGYVNTGPETRNAPVGARDVAGRLIRHLELPREQIHGKFLHLDGSDIPF